jgi:hypothetical protein
VSEALDAFRTWIENFDQTDPDYPPPSMLVLNGMADALEERACLLDRVAHLEGLLALARDNAKAVRDAHPNTPFGVISVYRTGLPCVPVQADAETLVESIDHTLAVKP